MITLREPSFKPITVPIHSLARLAALLSAPSASERHRAQATTFLATTFFLTTGFFAGAFFTATAATAFFTGFLTTGFLTAGFGARATCVTFAVAEGWPL